MEPAGRYLKENFSCLVKPKLRECKAAFCSLARTIWLLLAAICFALAFAVAAIRKTKHEKTSK